MSEADFHPDSSPRFPSILRTAIAGGLVLGGLGLGLEKLTFNVVNDGPTTPIRTEIMTGEVTGRRYECGDGILIQLDHVPNRQAVACLPTEGK